MTSTSKNWKELTLIFPNLNNFHSLEVVDRVSKTQLQVGENSNWIIMVSTVFRAKADCKTEFEEHSVYDDDETKRLLDAIVEQTGEFNQYHLTRSALVISRLTFKCVWLAGRISVIGNENSVLKLHNCFVYLDKKTLKRTEQSLILF